MLYAPNVPAGQFTSPTSHTSFSSIVRVPSHANTPYVNTRTRAVTAAARGVTHIDYAALQIPHQDGHMDYRGALAYSLRLGKDLREVLGPR